MSSERLVPPAQSAVVLARLSGVGSQTVSAFSSAYDDEFPSALDGIGAFVVCIALFIS